MTKNPWEDLPENGRYILRCDRDPVDEFNRRHPNEIQEKSLPEPYIGDPFAASILILGLNPGHREDDAASHTKRLFLERWANLLHRRRRFPFYPLDPALAWSPVARWWRARFGQLLSRWGEEHLSHRIAAIEWFPYHSQKNARIRDFFSSIPPLKSQQYAFQLAAKSLSDRRKVVIVLWGRRARDLWHNSLASVGSGLENAIGLRNHQCPYLTPGNMEPDDYRRLFAVLEK